MFKKVQFITTNCECLDKLIGEGIPKSQVTLIYGESNTGKTTIALQCAVSAGRKDWSTLYIDCKNNFSVNRLAQIALDNLSFISSNILVSKLQSFREQTLLIENIDNYISKNTALIIVDTINFLYRIELKSPQLIFFSNRILNRQLAYLNQIAKSKNVVVLLISQVQDTIIENKTKIEPVATRVVKFWAQNILKINRDLKPSVRKITLEKHLLPSQIGSSCFILLNKTGVTNFIP